MLGTYIVAVRPMDLDRPDWRVLLETTPNRDATRQQLNHAVNWSLMVSWTMAVSIPVAAPMESFHLLSPEKRRQQSNCFTAAFHFTHQITQIHGQHKLLTAQPPVRVHVGQGPNLSQYGLRQLCLYHNVSSLRSCQIARPIAVGGVEKLSVAQLCRPLDSPIYFCWTRSTTQKKRSLNKK